MEKKTILFMLIAISAVSLLSWVCIDIALMPSLDEFRTKAIATFVSFLVIPAIFLALGLPAKRGLSLGKLDIGFVASLCTYLIFGVWILLYSWVQPDYFKQYSIGSTEHLNYIVMVGIYVPPVDFFTRRVIQLEVLKTYGEWPGFYAATIAWILGHAPEFIWLSELMGPVGSAVFLVVSGLVTGLLYMRFRNAFGLMTGHWAINVMISIVTSMLL